MNNLTPPTDNLYKFLAIAGVTLMIIGIISGVTKFNEFSADSAQYTMDSAALRADVDTMNVRLKIAEKSQKTSASETNEIRNKLEAIERQRANLEARFENEKAKVQDLHTQKKYVTSLVTVGLVAAVIGFVSWYFRVQVYQDAVTRLDAEQRALELQLKVLELGSKQREGLAVLLNEATETELVSTPGACVEA